MTLIGQLRGFKEDTAVRCRDQDGHAAARQRPCAVRAAVSLQDAMLEPGGIGDRLRSRELPHGVVVECLIVAGAGSAPMGACVRPS